MVGAPVIVVGNITVGGTGKTPLVIYLARRAYTLGYNPGVVLRGYGGRARTWPQRVTSTSDAAKVGDEAVLIAERARCPVAAAPDRVAAARLLTREDCNLIISDDGLQHYRLARTLEIAVVDVNRGLGNGWCLPAGPLREPPSRLKEVNLVIANGGHWQGANGTYQLIANAPKAIAPGAQTAPAQGARIHAVAGIGEPSRFFQTLHDEGYLIEAHRFPDHHDYTAPDLAFKQALPIIMTEKDAVKCRHLALRDLWYLPVSAHPDDSTAVALDKLLVSLAGEPEDQ